MLTVLQGIALITAAIATGVMAGVFFAYSTAAMPGLRRTDDRTFVAAFQAMDRAIINPLFLTTFFGALVLAAAATVFSIPADNRSVLPWALSALLLYLTVFAITVVINVPRNDELKGTGDPDGIADLAAVRRRFDERRWTRWNHVRTAGSALAFAALAWALVQYGREVL